MIVQDITALPPPSTTDARLRRFLQSPMRVKFLIAVRRVKNWLDGFPSPILLPFGIWWLAERSDLDLVLSTRGFEKAETNFVQRLLKPGATVLDVGAHHGFYSLLASKLVGPAGRVIAFEPSPRERNRLKRHIRINSCSNVHVCDFALGKTAKRETLHLVDGSEDWCNSLRPPAVQTKTTKIEIDVKPLDEFLKESPVAIVDFVKLDVEGGEMDVLIGAMELLRSSSRPILMVEVEDIRTKPWGYRASEIVRLLAEIGYQWFSIAEEGLPYPIASDQEKYDANLVAVPQEKVSIFEKEMAIVATSHI
jgi:FkbM family methyltransferase